MLLFANLLVLGFLYKIFSRKPLFAYIREKHGIQTLRQCRVFEKLIIRYEKTLQDLRFLLACKKEGLIPTLARPKLSIATSAKIRKGIAAVIIKAELKNKHRIRNELKKEIAEKSRAIRETTSFLLFNALRYKIRTVAATRRKKWKEVHNKKLDALRSKIQPNSRMKATTPTRNVVHNFSSYTLSEKEYEVLSYSLDHYIPGRDVGKHTQVEFERFYQDILNHTPHLPERERIELKTQFLDTFNRYSKIKLPQEQRKIIESLYKNPDLSILRQDKGRGVVILNRVDYANKAEAFLNGPEFERLESDPTESFQQHVQKTLLSMKKKFHKKLYKKLYPSSSRPGLFFGLAKVHKLKEDTYSINNLPLRPVISNIGTATYELSKYLANLLQPLTKNEYTIDSTKHFVEKIRGERIPRDHEMVSFDVVSLFTNVPLDFTINLILDKVYREKAIRTKLEREELKKLLEICTKEMHFSFNGAIYKQINGVAMGSPLGPVIANICMAELEKVIIPQLGDKISLWQRYVDDTCTFIKKGETEAVLDVLNGFHESINFTYEKEVGGAISFLDVKLIRKEDGSFETDVHRKETDTNVYMHWESYAPSAWKIGTMKSLIRRAHIICSNSDFLEKEISFLKSVFRDENGFPSRVVSSVIHDVKTSFQEPNERPDVVENETEEGEVTPVGSETEEREVTPFICLQYKGKEGEAILSKFKTALKNALPKNVKPRFTYKGNKVGSLFRLKDPVPIEHQSNLVYNFKQGGKPLYVGQTNVRYESRVDQHCTTDKQSSVFKFKEDRQIDISAEDFEIIDKGYPRTWDRRLAEALYVKEFKEPELNRQKRSAKLLLFN